jgi:hypothetical protein
LNHARSELAAGFLYYYNQAPVYNVVRPTCVHLNVIADAAISIARHDVFFPSARTGRCHVRLRMSDCLRVPDGRRPTLGHPATPVELG